MADSPRQDLSAAGSAPRGIAPRVLQSWWAPRRVVRGLADMPDRALIVVLMVAMLIFLAAQAPGHARAAVIDPSIPLEARMGGAMLAVMFLMPLVAYGVAALVSALMRLTPWRLSPRHSRLALFWALLAVAPAMVLAGMVSGLIGPGPAQTLTQALAGIGFVVIWGAGIAALVERA